MVKSVIIFNMRYCVLFFLLAMLQVFIGCAVLGDEEKPKYACEFKYDEKVKNEMILPLLKDKAKKVYRYFNFENPSLMVGEGGVVKIRLFVTKADSKGYIIRNEKTLVVVVDPCQMTVVEFYWQGSPVSRDRGEVSGGR